MDIGLLSAFIGGFLALLSPCGALLLPAFFASTVGSGPRLWVHGAVFYVGLLLVLVPLGIGAGAVGSVFATHRGTIIVAASAVLIVLGAVQALGFGFGFDAARFLPGTDALQNQLVARAGLVKTVLLGAASGVSGFCAGPILGAVLTLAAAQGDVFTASTLLAVYGAGMVLPLVVLAALWGRIGARTRALLRGHTFTCLGRELHSTSVVTGVLIIMVGILFWTTNGLIGVPELLPTDVQAGLQSGVAVLANPIVDAVVLAVLAGGGLLVWKRMRTQGRAEQSRSRTTD